MSDPDDRLPAARAPIAIVGMACIFPQAHNLGEFWDNVVKKRDCITEVPASRWKIDDYYDPDPSAPDKTYSKRGGFIPDVDFDPVEFGLPPNVLEVTDNTQLLSLLVARQALADAGYGPESGRTLDRERTGIVLGVGGGLKLITPLTSRLQYPIWEEAMRSSGLSAEDAHAIAEKIKLAYVPWEENSFPGMLGNVIAGRVANRLDLGGINCVVDAACASSLAALRLAQAELADGQTDTMLVGGVDADNSPFMYMCFSKTPAFSRQDRIRPFDAESDGMMVGEGIGIVVLRRLADAERDGDRIYAVIRGIGSSSDGRYKSIYAPRSEGQARALARAYRNADIGLDTVGLIEAHGTGTVAGDLVEVGTLRKVFEGSAAPNQIALGSVKSQIGHTKSAAGAAGLIKAALALHHKVLPATINVTEPHPAGNFGDSPLYLNTETRPWLPANGEPRRAGVSSFGFGGTNYHVVLEEYEPEQTRPYRLQVAASPVVLSAPTPEALAERCREVAASLDGEQSAQRLEAIAAESAVGAIPAEHARVGFVAETAEEVRRLLAVAIGELARRGAAEVWEDPRGLFYRRRGLDLAGRVVALFPGQGAQYVDMGRELGANFPEVRAALAEQDALFRADGRAALSSIVYPPPAFDDGGDVAREADLRRTEHAQPAIGALSAAMYRILRRTGFRPDFAAGHSFGELTALWAAGALADADFARLARARGRAMAPPDDPGFDAGAMVAVQADETTVRAALGAIDGVHVANVNAPKQVVVAGSTDAMVRAQAALAAWGLAATPLPVAAAFHTPLVEHARAAFAAEVAATPIRPPAVAVYSNATGGPYPTEPDAIRARLTAHLLEPVRFQAEIEAIYAAGGRLFVEVGPRNILTNLVGEILSERPHVAVALNGSRRPDSDRQLREALVRLRVAGLPIDARDAHRRAPDPVPARKRGGAVVQLNGSNYVSEQRQRAYRDAIENGHRIAAPPAIEPVIQAPEQVGATPAHAQVGAGQTYADAGAAQSSADAARALSTLDLGLANFAQLQAETLRAHQQFLAEHGEQSRAYLEFMRQQQSLLLGPGAAAVPAGVQEMLARSMELFHELQRDTLRMHQSYIEGQTEQSRGYFQAMGQAAGVGAPGAWPAISAAPTMDLRALSATAHSAVTPAVALSPTDAFRSSQPAQPPPVYPAAGVPTHPQAPIGTASLAERAGRPHPDPLPDPEGEGTPEQRHGRTEPGRAHSAAPPANTPAASARHAAAAASAPHAAPAASPPHAAPAPTRVVVPAPVSAAAVQVGRLSIEAVTAGLLEVVADKTGYPPETLELEMDVEADLGIDSIKRVEILGAMRERFPSAPNLKPEELAELRTLQQIVDYLAAQAPSPAASAPNGQAGPGVNTTNGHTAVGVSAEGNGRAFGSGRAGTVDWHPVRLKSLPLPDRLGVELPAGTCCVVTDDGTPLTSTVVAALQEIGWPVATLALPAGLVPGRASLPSQVARATCETLDEADLVAALGALAERAPIGAFVHLHPAARGEGLFPPADEAIIKAIFLLAKHLKAPLATAAAGGGAARAAFAVVTRLGGELGLTDRGPDGAIAGGLFGLTKTLALEWPRVYCRAIDVDAATPLEAIARHLVAELLDPNRALVEVGYGPSGRVTPVAAEPVANAR